MKYHQGKFFLTLRHDVREGAASKREINRLRVLELVDHNRVQDLIEQVLAGHSIVLEIL